MYSASLLFRCRHPLSARRISAIDFVSLSAARGQQLRRPRAGPTAISAPSAGSSPRESPGGEGGGGRARMGSDARSSDTSSRRSAQMAHGCALSRGVSGRCQIWVSGGWPARERRRCPQAPRSTSRRGLSTVPRTNSRSPRVIRETVWLDGLLRCPAVGMLEHSQRGTPRMRVDFVALTEVSPKHPQRLRRELLESCLTSLFDRRLTRSAA
jgi:hypothetical protein